MPAAEWTQGEQQRAIERLESAVKESTVGLHRRLDDLEHTFVRKDVYELRLDGIEKRISNAANWVKALVVTLAGGVVSGLGVIWIRHP